MYISDTSIRVITNLAKVVEPILDVLAAFTGFKFSLLGGGPEPADGGRLNMIWYVQALVITPTYLMNVSASIPALPGAR